jgi:hypothetical protein
MVDNLRVDWCEYKAAKFAVENWHYSGCMPAIKNVNIGVWEEGNFIGAVVFSRSANNNLGAVFNLDQSQYAELTRVALTDHKSPVSQIVSYAIKKLNKKDTGLECLFSYADPMQDHSGTIYQAMNWYYLGRGAKSRVGKPKGYDRWMHGRQIGRLSQTGQIDRDMVKWKKVPGKHKYVYPLDDRIEEKVKELSKPYP